MAARDRIQQAILEQRYRIGSHANEEMADDDLEAHDIETIILTGKVVRRFTHDPRGTRYEILGATADGRHAYVICRFLPSGVLLIIRGYKEEE